MQRTTLDSVLAKYNMDFPFHPAVLKLGLKYADGTIKGANARCIAMLDMLREMVEDYSTPSGMLPLCPSCCAWVFSRVLGCQALLPYLRPPPPSLSFPNVALALALSLQPTWCGSICGVYFCCSPPPAPSPQPPFLVFPP